MSIGGERSKLALAAIWFALGIFLLAAIGIPMGVAYISNPNMSPQERFQLAQFIASTLGVGGAIVAFSFAVFQYRRAESWKRTEFIAKEIKDFESDPLIQNALLMIDWGSRRINLFLYSNPTHDQLVKITREVQWKALLPHPIKRQFPDYRTFTATEEQQESKDNHKKIFTNEEAKIRDTYDALLTRLDRFATFIDSGLISARELKPFIIYWVNAITENNHPEDTAWRFTLLAYINFYGYSGVKNLLRSYGKDISVNGPIWRVLKNSLQDKDLPDRLSRSAELSH
ncbi:MAG TPA: hypothetical protein VF075_04630 [Pyrinomonadaceae bacterium]